MSHDEEVDEELSEEEVSSSTAILTLRDLASGEAVDGVDVSGTVSDLAFINGLYWGLPCMDKRGEFTGVYMAGVTGAMLP